MSVKAQKKLSSFGRNLLEELETSRKNLLSGALDPGLAKINVTQANATSRALHESVYVEKFELGKCLIK